MKGNCLLHSAQDTVQVSAGHAICIQGYVSSELLGIAEGNMQLQTVTQVVAIFGADGILGQMTLSDNVVTSDAVADVALGVIDKHRPLSLVHQTPVTTPVTSAVALWFRTRAHLGVGS
jgi:hypothetical protein